MNKTSGAADVSLKAIIHMDIEEIGSNMLKSKALKWKVTKGTSSNVTEELAEGNFIDATSGKTLTLVSNIDVTQNKTYYTVWIWLDANANPSDNLSGETLKTSIWTEINQAKGVEDRFEITRIQANYQTISATVVDNKYKVTHYAITSTNSEPNEWTAIDSNDQNNVYNFTYDNISETGTYYIWFKDNGNRIRSKSIQVSSIANAIPVCNFGSWSKVSIADNERATITLTCTDTDSEITSYNLKTTDFTKSNNNLNITDVTRREVTNGYEYTITVTGTDNDGTTSITIPENKIKNAMYPKKAGNVEKTSQVITIANNYTVTFVTGNNACTLDSTTYANKTATYGTPFELANPTCSSPYYSFTGWTANNGLDTTNAKYGDASSTLTNTWSDGTIPVSATWFTDLALNSTKTVTLTANWEYKTYNVTLNQNGGSGGTSALYGRYNDGVYLDSARTSQLMTTNDNPITVPTKTGYTFQGYASPVGPSIALGDYVLYTPSVTSYQIDASKTGYSDAQTTINPSELTTWRVINLNPLELISNNTSSNNVYFTGITAYKNYVGYLNTIASQYETPGITSGSRYFGYNGQTQIITDTSKITASSAPWTCSIDDEGCVTVESQGGGDKLYQRDASLLTAANVPLQAANNKDYWVASRYYYYSTSNGGAYLNPRIVYNGAMDFDWMYSFGASIPTNYAIYYALRPIVTISTPALFSSGSGTSLDPWVTSSIPILWIDSNGYKTSAFDAENKYEDITMTAFYTPTPYTITYNLDGGSQVSPKTTYTIEDADFTLVTPTKEGYLFTGWTGDNGSTPQDTVTITQGTTGNKTYTANWTTVNYTLSFSNAGGDGTPETMTAVDGPSHSFTLPATPIPTKGTSNFLGWGLNSSDSNVEYPASGYQYPTLAISANDSSHPWTQVNGGYKSSIQNLNNTTTNLTYTFELTQADTLSFEWSVSSESASYDYLYYSIYKDGSTTAMSGTGTSTKIGGTTHGTADDAMTYLPVSVSLTAGSYRLVFTYRKDSTTSRGTDAGYVKNVTVGENEPSGILYSPANVTLTYSNNTVTLYAKYGTAYKADIYYHDANDSFQKETLLCAVLEGSQTSTCDVTIPNNIKNSGGKYNTTYFGLSSSLNSMTPSVNASASTITLSGYITYYAIYQSTVTEYMRGTSRTLYRNNFWTSLSSYGIVISTSSTGTSNITPESYTCGGDTCDWYGYATENNSGISSYSTVSSLATSTTDTVYAIYSIDADVNIYYHYDDAQTSQTINGYRLFNYQGTFVKYTSITLPYAITGSKGPHGAPYKGLSIVPSSTTTTTEVTPATANYYAVYGGSFTVTFAIGSNVSAIGSTQQSCSASYTTNGTNYSGTDCAITLPSVTASSGYTVFGWYDGLGLMGQPGDTIYLSSNSSMTAEAGILEAKEFFYDNTESGANCGDVQCMLTYLANGDHTSQAVSLGDYISYTPSKTSYTIDTSITGYTGEDQETLNPSELTLWRVLRKNADGSIEIISNDVSSINIYFQGLKGVQNNVGYLNIIATQYENPGITIGSRCFGYNGQTLVITDTSKITNPAPWNCSTDNTCTQMPVESQGGGDRGFMKDRELLQAAGISTIAYSLNGSDTDYYYWMASRGYSYAAQSSYYWGIRSAAYNNYGLYVLYRYSSTGFIDEVQAKGFRPIVILKPGLTFSGSGTSADPWTIN